MLRLDFTRLTLHQQVLYKLSGSLVVGAFLMGLLWVLLGLSDQQLAAEKEWRPTLIPQADDVAAQFLTVTEKSRWYIDASRKTREQRKQDPIKSLEGTPESMRLTGLVRSGDKTYALFLPLTSAGTKTAPALRQLTEGDILVGEWVIKSISTNQVEIQQGEEIRTLKMYQPSST